MKRQLKSRMLALVFVASLTTGILAYAPPASAARYGPYRLSNFVGGKCMDFTSTLASPGSWIVLNPCSTGSGGPSQKFWLYSVGANLNEIRPAMDTRLCLDIQNGSNSNGAQLILWWCNGQANQRFYDYWPDLGPYYHLQQVQHSGQCLQAHGGSPADGTRVTQWNACIPYWNPYYKHMYWSYLPT
jgi:hypothetical protein